MKSIKGIYKIGRGPSSSHTIGPQRASYYYRNRHPECEKYRVTLFGSLSKTGKGHGTDRVIRDTFGQDKVEIVFCNDEYPDSWHPNTMVFETVDNGKYSNALRIESTGGGDIRIDGVPEGKTPEIYPENSFAEIEAFCRFRGVNIAEYVEINEGNDIQCFLSDIWEAMKESISEGLSKDGILPGGLRVDRKAKAIYENTSVDLTPEIKRTRILSSYAFAVGETNADCGTIVTAPTCGSCGVLPAVLMYIQQSESVSDKEIIEGLAVAGIIGNLVRHNASISGAECGCQAEIGTACSMAAAAVAHIRGLSINQIHYAAEMSLEHHLGLTCDPICGLVQVPCIERNAVAANRALDSCDMAYYLSDTQRITLDMVVKTMQETGWSMNARFKETSEGGLAKMFDRNRL